MKYLLAVLFVCLSSTFAAIAQTSSAPKEKNFHVTDVSVTDVSKSSINDYCPTGACTASRIIVSGFVKEPRHPAIRYVLECIETTPVDESRNMPKGFCARVQAGEDYSAKFLPAAVSFWWGKKIPMPEHGVLVDYDIKTQKEVR